MVEDKNRKPPEADDTIAFDPSDLDKSGEFDAVNIDATQKFEHEGLEDLLNETSGFSKDDLPDLDDDGAPPVAGAGPRASGKPAAGSKPGGAANNPAAALAQQVQKLQAERDQLHERLLRTAADYQNYARRAEQNIQAAREQQVMDVAKALLTVLDHFDRALEVEAQDSSGKAILEGVQMVHTELLGVLSRFGVTRIDAAPGDEFDPSRHEALMRQKVESMAPNHVATQLQVGYALGEKILRPAKVAVSE